MTNDYTMEGRQIFSLKGKLVATLNDDGVPVMAPGMAGPHTAGVRAFLEVLAEHEEIARAQKSSAEDFAAVVKEKLTTEDPVPEQKELKSDEVEESKEA